MSKLNEMGYEQSFRQVKIIAILDIVFSSFPIVFYTVFTFIFGFIVLVGYFNAGYDFLDWILKNTMTIQDVVVDIENPGQAADVRMFRCSVWGIALLFNLLEFTMGFMLLQSLKKSKTEEPFIMWIALKAVIVFVMFVLIIALLSTGTLFLGILVSIFYIIYRSVAIWLVYKHYRNIRELGGVP